MIKCNWIISVSLFLAPLFSWAQNAPLQGVSYPSKPVLLINPYAPGGPTDLLSRMMAKGLGEQLQQTVLV